MTTKSVRSICGANSLRIVARSWFALIRYPLPSMTAPAADQRNSRCPSTPLAILHPLSSILYLYPRLAYSAAIWGPFSATERFISSTRMTRNAATFKGANNSDRPTIVTTRGQTTCIGLISRFISDSQ